MAAAISLPSLLNTQFLMAKVILVALDREETELDREWAGERVTLGQFVGVPKRGRVRSSSPFRSES